MSRWDLVTIALITWCLFAGFQAATSGSVWAVPIQVVAAGANIFFLYASIKRHNKQCTIKKPKLMGFGFVKGKFLYTNADSPERVNPFMLIVSSEWDGSLIAVSKHRAYMCHYEWRDESLTNLVIKAARTGTLLPRYIIRERLWLIPKSLKTTIRELIAEV